MASNRLSLTRILIWLTAGLLAALGLAADSSGAEGTPRWTENLSERWGLRPFQIDIRRTWTRQQGVVFISPQRIAVYQVNQLKAPADLSGRDASGGGGNFRLEVRVFDVQGGHIVKAFRMRTSA